MEQNSKYVAHFTGAYFIDKAGAALPTGNISFGDVFRQLNRSQGQWLRRFFDGGNCLCHPSILIRRYCYDEVGHYDNRFRQLPDLDMWTRVLKRHPIYVSEERMVHFRLMPGENTSTHNPANVVRASNEHYLIACSFFDGVDKEVLAEGFGDLMIFKDPPTPDHYEIEKALLYFTPNRWLGHVYVAVGVRRLFELLEKPPSRAILINDYGIDDLEFQRRTAMSYSFRQPLSPSTISRDELLREFRRRAARRIQKELRRFRF
jgi:hypothetical protein